LGEWHSRSLPAAVVFIGKHICDIIDPQSCLVILTANNFGTVKASWQMEDMIVAAAAADAAAASAA